MHYISTRGKAAQASLTQTLLNGLAPDGGLYLPTTLPHIDPQTLIGFRGLSYEAIAYSLFKPFFEELFPAGHSQSTSTLKSLIAKSYQTFRSSERIAIQTLTPYPKHKIHLAELFHGPTYAFKDFALQFLANITETVLAEKGKSCIVLGATSGDTGSAAIEAFKNVHNGKIVILHPHNRTSLIQRKQMTTTGSPNVINLAVEGTFDDCQRLVKACFNDPALTQALNGALIAVNSINWVRILAQSVYYFHIYSRLYHRLGEDPGENNNSPNDEHSTLRSPTSARSSTHTDANSSANTSAEAHAKAHFTSPSNTLPLLTFAVPTGNFGDIFAGYLALKMGLPVNKLIVATNTNDILHRFFQTNVYTPRPIKQTHSPSMDIATASNFERLLYYLLDEDPSQVTAALSTLNTTGTLSLPPANFNQATQHFLSTTTSNKETLTTIAEIYRTQHYLLDPHTAVGVHSALQYLKIPKSSDLQAPHTPTPQNTPTTYPKSSDSSHTVVLATAHPAKFKAAIETIETIDEQDTSSRILSQTISQTLSKTPSQTLSKSASHNGTSTTHAKMAQTNATQPPIPSDTAAKSMPPLADHPQLHALDHLMKLEETFKIIPNDIETLKKILLSL